MTPFMHTYTVDVRSGMRCERARRPVGQGDALADRFVVAIMDGSAPVDLTGVGVVATVIRPDGLTVALEGVIENGAACVTLDDKCYDVGGSITVTVSLEAGKMRQSVLQVAMNVATGETDVIAETSVLNVADVLAAAERAEAAAERAEAAGGGGGSGTGLPTGGAAHQQLVTDADGKALWEDRTHYTYVEDAEILPSSYLINADGQFVGVDPVSIFPANEARCVVTWNEVDYGCTAENSEIEGIPCSLFGNTSIVGGTQTTNDPFCVVLISPENASAVGFGVMAVALDGSETVTIAISGQAEVVKKLDKKFIPEAANSNVRNGAGEYSIVAGYGSNSEGQGSAAFGLETTALGHFSHSEGRNTLADGSYSHAEGDATLAGGDGSHAEGNGTEATGNSSHAEGCETVASGNYSHAEGWYAYARGNYSHAEGADTFADSDYQHVQGKYNARDYNNKYAHIVGNGKDDSARSNAHTVDWDGNAWFAGDVHIGGTSQDDAKKLATVEDVLAALPTWTGGAY